MTHDQINEEVLAAYLKGELDAADAAAVEAWYDASAAHRKMLGEVYYILFLNDRIQAAAEFDTEESLRRLKMRMHAARRPARSLRRIVWRVAAAVVLGAALTAGAWRTVSVAERLERPVAVYTDLNERSQVVLPDGTKVWLNACSRLEYSTPLFSRERRVKMEGEAYFEVEKDKHAPFVVRTNGLDIRVLGTKFNVRNDTARHTVTAVLLEGAVLAHASDALRPAVRLRPSQQLVFDTRDRHMALSDCTSAQRAINWIEGRFQFEQNTFEEIVGELERYYNMQIRFMDESLKQERFSGNFKGEDGIYHIMSILQLTYKFHYKVDRTGIELYANDPRKKI